MALLGRAIASYLSKLSGLYSVELPAGLESEMIALVDSCNSDGQVHALLVTDQPTSVIFTPWAEILKWRTDDDRIFVWSRGSREPDSSFRSVVKPFIGSRFPGGHGGGCTLDLLARISVQELWKNHNFFMETVTFGAFLDTAKWVAKVLYYSFEQVGSTPSSHWSDEFLIHWARIFNELDEAFVGLDNRAPLPRHAWELIRVAGLPVPATEGVGNPFHDQPIVDKFSYRDPGKYAKEWQKIVDEFVLPQGEIASLLSALDKVLPGNPSVNSWRNLQWDIVPLSSIAPVAGNAIFTSGSPSLLSFVLPVFPPPAPAWWGVTDKDLSNALNELAQISSLKPHPDCDTFISPSASQPNLYILDTSLGVITFNHTSKKWNANLELKDLKILFQGPSRDLIISPIEPENPQDGTIWINKDDVSVICKDTRPSNVECAINGGEITIQFDLVVLYKASIDSDGNIIGDWKPLRYLEFNGKASSYINGKWTEPRDIEAAFALIIPSPFSPTILITRTDEKQLIVSPMSSDEFATLGEENKKWNSTSTPDVLLKEEGTYEIDIYDGRINPSNSQLLPPIKPIINDTPIDKGSGGRFWQTKAMLDEDDIITARIENSDDVIEIATVHVKQRSDSVSSGLLSAIRKRPSGRKQPSQVARKSVLGQYQDKVVAKLSLLDNASPNSLYQYVISSLDTPTEWPVHNGNPSPDFLFTRPSAFSLPGIGNGPSDALVGTVEWTRFMDAIKSICEAIGLGSDDNGLWMSGFDPSVIPASTIKAYIDAHSELVRAAKKQSITDAFWSAYPFSLIIVEGASGQSFGQLSSILLSPLHPARLGWAFSVAFVARRANVGSSTGSPLLGFAEGWNIPYTGFTVNLAGNTVPLIAVPVDPGEEQDFATWSALAVLSNTGLAELPASVANLPLPWGGRTGINARVIERSIRDYLAVHKHHNTLEIDIRSVTAAPRSQEIDEAILRFIVGDYLDEVEQLGGQTRVWDSMYRQGPPPTRDRLFDIQEQGNSPRAFEWRRYKLQNLPTNADIAFVENASVHLSPINGTVNGLLGLLPLRRFTPSLLRSDTLDQNYSTRPGEDVIGLASLLAEIEFETNESLSAMRATPQTTALGIGIGARWEVLGTFNMDPSLLASIVSRAQSAGNRLLWEWRPSWLSQGSRSNDELARRPYYVVAKTPSSIITTLFLSYSIEEDQASQMLAELGNRGIGLAALYATGGSQASAAAGFFYALRLLLPPNNHALPATWMPLDKTNHIYSLIPVDPIDSILSELAEQKYKRRVDLLMVRLIYTNDMVNICFIPVEIKHHGSIKVPENVRDDKELTRAKEQLVHTSLLLEDMARAIHPATSTGGDILACYIRRLGLTTLLDLAMSLAPINPGPEARSTILKNVLEGRVAIGVGLPLLLWFTPGTFSAQGSACVIDYMNLPNLNGREMRAAFIDPSVIPGLWWRNHTPDSREIYVRGMMDDVISSSLLVCNPSVDVSDVDIRIRLMDMLGLDNTTSIDSKDTPYSDRDGQFTMKIDSPPVNSVGSSQSNSKDIYLDTSQVEPLHTDTSTLNTQPLLQRSTVSIGNPAIEPESVEQPREEYIPPTVSLAQTPRAFVGWNTATSRWSLIGKLPGSLESVALDLDHPKAIGIFGYMGSGKSYLVGAIAEAALEQIPAINNLTAPLSVVIFNYRRNAADRFELASLAIPNQNKEDNDRLVRDYAATPKGIKDIHILCLPGELTPERLQEYNGLPASELFFDPSSLSVEDWELLMGDPGSEALFARTIRHALGELRASGHITIDKLEQHVLPMLTKQSRNAAQLRFQFVRRYISQQQSSSFANILIPGRAVVIDLRGPLFTKEDALRFFLVCTNHISQVQGRFNKIVIFDEAHEYLSATFSEKIETRIRQMRHEGTSYVFATQDVDSIPPDIRRFITTRFVFSLGSRQNVDDLLKFAPEFKGQQLLRMKQGHCLVQSDQSDQGLFDRPREVWIRPRVTQHGGASRIFSNDGKD